MPSDIIGTRVVVEDDAGKKHFSFQKGPVFTQVLLADEINRATPKTQSALLEAMQEKAVTVAGQRHALEPPFFVLATQNPLEMEGTYPLPEAQLDRFCSLVVSAAGRPVKWRAARGSLNLRTRMWCSKREVVRMIERQTRDCRARREICCAIVVSDPSDTVRPPYGQTVNQIRRQSAKVASGDSGGKSRLFDGRFNVSVDDIKQVSRPSLRHRLILNFEGKQKRPRPTTSSGDHWRRWSG